MSKGKAIIFSAPSGSGKTTIVKHLINKIPDLGFLFLPVPGIKGAGRK
jgi:guanylate kinase